MIIFSAGTDTGIGKTFITGLLARFFLNNDVRVKVQKWASTGRLAYSDDLAFIYGFMGQNRLPMAGHSESPYCFSFPASPHLAAEMEGKTIDKGRLIETTHSLAAECDMLIIEGTGGILAPLTRDILTIDLIAELELPVVLVARSGLGTINHTLLTLEAIKKRNIEILCTILNNQDDISDPLIVNDNLKTIQDIGDVPVFGPIPRVKEPQDAIASIEPAGRYLAGCLKEAIKN